MLTAKAGTGEKAAMVYADGKIPICDFDVINIL